MAAAFLGAAFFLAGAFLAAAFLGAAFFLAGAFLAAAFLGAAFLAGAFLAAAFFGAAFLAEVFLAAAFLGAAFFFAAGFFISFPLLPFASWSSVMLLAVSASLRFFSSRTRSLNRLPRSSKSLNWSNEAQAGDSRTTGAARRSVRACSAAAATAFSMSPQTVYGTRPSRVWAKAPAASPIRKTCAMRGKCGESVAIPPSLARPPAIQ